MSLADTISAALRRLLAPRLATMQSTIKAELKAEIKVEVKAELRAELESDFKAALFPEMESVLDRLGSLFETAVTLQHKLDPLLTQATETDDLDHFDRTLRGYVRSAAGLSENASGDDSIEDLLREALFLHRNQLRFASLFGRLARRRVLFAGQAYYNAWYLSRSLRELGWKADVLNWDMDPASQIYYHGEDFRFTDDGSDLTLQGLRFYVASLYAYDVFHFSNAHAISFGSHVQSVFTSHLGRHSEIELLKGLGKKIVYTNNGCLDGVSQSSFSTWGPESICSICRWRAEPSVCSDEKNLSWGLFRNKVADYQCLLGGNRIDFNDDATVHEVPEFYCLDTQFWAPGIHVPAEYLLAPSRPDTVWVYHAVGNRDERTTEDGVNIKSSHVYLPLIERLKDEGVPVELLEPVGIPNKQVRFIQAQADIFLDMLTYGWFGATVREAMMLGKPVICYIRPEWLESLREEIPQYADELPIISATPQTVEAVLRELIAEPEKRREIGARSRAFAVKWHSAQAGGRRFNEIYTRLLQGDPQLRVMR